MRYRTAVGLAIALGLVGAAAVRQRAEAIRRNPDPYPYDVLSREPQGETSFVERPDGTRIRVVSAGSGPTLSLIHI